MATRMQQRRGTAAQWTDADPILASGEIGFESDTNQFKIGDGVNHWSDLSYFKNLQDLGGSLDDYIPLTEKGQPDGVAQLDENGKIPSSQIPDLVGLDSEIASSVSNAISTEVSNRNEAIADAIDTEVSDRNSAISSAISTEVTNRNSAIADAVSDLESEISTSVADAVDNLVNGAPAALDTLNEIATVIGDSDDIVGSLITNITGLNTAVATHASKTTNVHGIADVNALATKQYVDDQTGPLTDTVNDNYSTLQDAITDAVSTHNSDTTGVHGIDDTTQLATKTYADGAVNTHANLTEDVHGIADFTLLATQSYADDKASEAQSAAEASATTALGEHTSSTADVHGITDTADLVYTSDSRLSDERTPSAGSVTAAKIATDAVETAKIKDLNVTTAKIADSAITSAKIEDGTIVNGDISATAAIAQSKISGLTSDLASKQDKVANVSDTEIGYLDGVTSAIQTQLDAKATTSALSSHEADTTNIHGITDTSKLVTTDGTQTLTNKTITSPSGLVKADVGLGNVDNTSDANKPISSATQTALDLKAPKAAPTFTGTTTTADLTVTGNLTVNGTTTTVSSTNLEVTDPLIYIGTGNSANSKDLGVVGHFDNGTYQHTGIVRDATDGKWKLFSGVTTEPSDTIDFATYTKDTLVMGALEATSATIGNVSNTELQYLDGVTSAIQTQMDAKAPLASPTFTGTVTLPSGTVTSAMIVDGTIVDADINASAAIAQSKISGLSTSLAAKAPLATPSFTGGVTVDSSGIIFADGTQTKEGVVSRTPIVQKTASYTLSALTERDSLIEIASASGVTLTVPTNATVAYPVGTSIDILQTSTGQITVAGAAGVTVNATPGLKLRTQWSGATLFKRATDTWVLYGDLSA
jgi:metal-responsive CopG/Arc/MetJ family transcriptional regulator